MICVANVPGPVFGTSTKLVDNMFRRIRVTRKKGEQHMKNREPDKGVFLFEKIIQDKWTTDCARHLGQYPCRDKKSEIRTLTLCNRNTRERIQIDESPHEHTGQI